MSIVMYRTSTVPHYYYALEIGMPEDTVSFGEGDSPAGAVRNLEPTQYQSAYFGCRGPANSRLAELFDLDIDDAIIDDCTDSEEQDADTALR